MSLISSFLNSRPNMGLSFSKRISAWRKRRERSLAESVRMAACDVLEPRLMLSSVGFNSNVVLSTDVGQVVCADFNNDGKMDMAATALLSSKVVVMLGNGNGTFGSAVNYTANGKYFLATGDFNADGNADLVSANGDKISILLGKGDGTFADTIEMTHGVSAAGLAVGDFNGDGLDDFAVTDGGGPQIHVETTKKTTGTNWSYVNFENISDIDVGDPQSYLAAGDFNKDGCSDIAYIDASYKILTVLKGKKKGIVTSDKIELNLGNSANLSAVSLADVNADGYQDLVYADTGASGVVGVMLSNKGNGFKAATTTAAGLSLENLSFADMNDDGKQDIVVSRSTSLGNIVVLLGNGDGTFTLDGSFNGGTSVRFAATGDLNGDQIPDVLSVDGYQSTVQALLNTSTHQVSATRSYSYVDADGDTVTISMTGPGTSSVTGGGSINAGADATGIVLDGTTSATTLKITVTKVKNSTTDGTTSLKSIFFENGTLGKLDAGKVNIDNTGTIYGKDDTTAIGTIILNNIGNSVTVTLKGTVAGSMTLSAGTLGDGSTLDFGTSAFKSMSLVSAGHSYIYAGNVEKLTVAENFYTKLTLTGNAKAKLNTLGTASIGGNVAAAGGFVITGSVGTMNLGSMANGYSFNVSGSINVFSVAGNIDPGSISAKSIGKWTVGGDISAGGFTLVGSADANFMALGSLTVGGSINAAGTLSLAVGNGGSIGTISASSITNFAILADKSSIEKIVVTGKKAKVKGGSNIEADATSLTVYAKTLGTLSIGRNLTNSYLTLGNDATGGTLVLKSMTVGGSATNGQVTVGNGNMGSFSIGSSEGLQIVCTSGSIDKIAITSNQNGGTVVAMAIGTWTVGGNLSNLLYQNKKTSVDSATELKKLTVKGDAASFVIIGDYTNVTEISIAGDWTNSNQIAINTLGTCTVGGDLSTVSFVLTSSDTTLPVALGKFSVTGNATGFTIMGDSSSGAGLLSFGSINGGQITFNSGRIASLTVVGDAVFGSDSNSPNSLSAKSFGTINIGTGKAGGDLKNVVLALIGDAANTDNTVVLNTLKVNGDMNAVKTSTGGNKGVINSITAGSLSNMTSLSIGIMSIKKLALVKNAKLGDTGSMSGHSAIYSNMLNEVTIAGDVTDGDIRAGTDATIADSAVALGKLTISGAVTSTIIGNFGGSVGTITLGSMASGTVTVRGSLTKLGVAGNMGDISVPGSISLSVGDKLGAWNVGGNLQSVLAQIGVTGNHASSTTTGKRYVVLDTLTVGGLVNAATLITQGSIGNISAKRMLDSNIFAGFDGDNNDYTSFETIGSIKIAGDKNFATSSVSNNHVYAWKIDTVVAGYPADNTFATTFGALEIGSLKVTRLEGKANITKSYTKLDHEDVAAFSEMGLKLELPTSISIVV